MEKNDGPARTLRDGRLKATIWRNEGEKGPYHSCTISRLYEDKKSGELRDTLSFSGKDMMRVSELARRNHNEIIRLDHDARRGRETGPAQTRDTTRDRGR